MADNLGKSVPNVMFKKKEGNELIDVHTDDIFQFKRVILFAVPGAFTPVCSNQLPGYEQLYDQFKELNVDEIYCVGINDTYVMDAWFQSLGIENVKYIADGNGEFSFQMNMMYARFNTCLGNRSWRYAAVINNKVIDYWVEEEGCEHNCPSDPLTVTSAQSVLEWCQTHAMRGDFTQTIGVPLGQGA